MQKLTLPPDNSGYASTEGVDVLVAKIDGGPARYRRDFIGATSTVNVTWRALSATGYKYLRAFFNTAAARGSVPFLADLILDDGALTEHECYFVPGTFGTQQVQGGVLFDVTAQFEVKPLPVDDAYNQGLIDAYAAFGEDSAEGLALLEQLVNVDLPNALA